MLRRASIARTLSVLRQGTSLHPANDLFLPPRAPFCLQLPPIASSCLFRSFGVEGTTCHGPHRRAMTHHGVTHLAELRNPAILCRLVRFRARGLLKPRGRAAEFFISQSHFKSPYSYSQPVVSFATECREKEFRPHQEDNSPGQHHANSLAVQFFPS